MRNTTLSVFVVALLMAAPLAHAQTTDMAAITARMQAIIKEMQSLQAEFASLQASVGNTSSGSQSNSGQTGTVGAVLGAATTNLQQEAVYGATNETIAKIQRLLATDPMIYADGRVTGFFGPLTEDAIKNLQSRFGMNPVGAVGPETAQLLMEYFLAYPSESYPQDVLKTRVTKPAGQVQGQSTSAPTTPAKPTTQTPSASTPLEAIYVRKDDGEVIVRVVYKDGRAFGVTADSMKEEDVVEAIQSRSKLTEAEILAVLDLDSATSRNEYDDGDAEDMLDEAEEALDEAEEAIDEAANDGEDTDDAEDLFDEAEELYEEALEDFEDDDYDRAYDKAKEARDLAEEAIDEVGGSSNDDDEEEEEAEEAIDDAKDAIDAAEEAIEEAEDDGEDVDDARELLEEAEDALDEAEEAFDDGDFDDAIELAEEAVELAEEAEDEL